MCEAYMYVIPFLFGSFFTVCHPYIDVHFSKYSAIFGGGGGGGGGGNLFITMV